MKYLNKFIMLLLNLLLTSCIFLLMFSFYSRSVFYDFFTNILINNFTTSIITYEEVYKDVDSTGSSDLDNLFNSSIYNDLIQDKDIQDLISKYVDQGLIDITTDNDLNDVDISGDLINFLIENKSMLEEKYGVTITDDDISSLKNNSNFNELNTRYKETIKNTRTIVSNRYKNYLKIYNFIISGLFKIIVFIIMIIDLLLLSILNRSLYKWISLLGINLVSSGSMTIILGIVSGLLINSFIKKLGTNYYFNFSYIIKIGTITLIIGIILYITYFLIEKFINKRKKEVIENEVSNYVE